MNSVRRLSAIARTRSSFTASLRRLLDLNRDYDPDSSRSFLFAAWLDYPACTRQVLASAPVAVWQDPCAKLERDGSVCWSAAMKPLICTIVAALLAAGPARAAERPDHGQHG